MREGGLLWSEKILPISVSLVNENSYVSLLMRWLISASSSYMMRTLLNSTYNFRSFKPGYVVTEDTARDTRNERSSKQGVVDNWEE